MKPEHGGVHGTASIVPFIGALSLATYLLRIYYPPGKQVFHFRLGNYPQYVGMFIVGIVTFRRDWVLKLTDKHRFCGGPPAGSPRPEPGGPFQAIFLTPGSSLK